MVNNYDFMFKLIIIGDSSVGKSCLLLRFTQGRFKTDHEPTLGVEFGSRNISIDGQSIKIQIWDTAGQQSFTGITRSYYKNSIAAILVFDITKRDSFQHLNKWLFQVKNNSHDKIQAVVIGNKCDLKDNREVSTEQGEKFAQTHGFNYFQTSAQSGYKVQEAFKRVAQRIVKLIQSRGIDPDSQVSYGIKRGKKSKKENPLTKPGDYNPIILSQVKKNSLQAPQNKKCCGG